MLAVYSLSLPLPAGMESWLRSQIPDSTLAVIARRKRQSDQHLSLLAHGALRHFLAPLLGCTPRAVPVTTLEHGKPVLDLDDTDLHFSLSHSGERVLIGIADQIIGVDIEAMRLPVKPGLVEHCSVPSERSWLKCDLDFYALWCGKEAALKHAGTGFHIQPQELSLDGHPRSRMHRTIPPSHLARFGGAQSPAGGKLCRRSLFGHFLCSMDSQFSGQYSTA